MPTPTVESTRLTARQMMALRLRRSGHTISAVADKLGIGNRAASALLARARAAEKKLRRAFERMLDEDSIHSDSIKSE